MIVGIDASNIRAGGGLTHLSCLLHSFVVSNHSINRLIVFAGKKTISQIGKHPDVSLTHISILDLNLIFRMIWQRWFLHSEVLKNQCDVLLSPGGILPRSLTVPSIVLSQNLLPFETKERNRFSLFSFMRYKMILVKMLQTISMQKADGIIFLSDYARNTILPYLNKQPRFIAKIPHGIEPRFYCAPRNFIGGKDKEFHLLYVSTVDVYKHQWIVAEAVAKLKRQGVSVSIEFVGDCYNPAKKHLLKRIKELDPESNFLNYRGMVPFSELHDIYRRADAFVFASSCENLPNILIEAMASGLPIVCSNKGPMPEVLKNCGLFFDPENSQDIAAKLLKIIEEPAVANKLSHCAFLESQQYSWERSARETFSFVEKVFMGVK